MDFHNRQYDPQLGRFMGIDPMADAAGQQGLSPYHAMACNPSTLTDPLGLYVKGEAHNGGGAPDFGMEMLRRFPTMPNFMARYLDFGERTAMQSMAEQQIMAERWIQDYFLLQSLGVAIEGLVVGNTSISIYTGVYAIAAIIGLQHEEEEFHRSQNEESYAYWNSVGGKAWYTTPNDGEPINLMSQDVTQRSFNNFYQHIKSTNDYTFYIVGHGNKDLVEDNSGPKKINMRTADEFDDRMSQLSPTYKYAIDNHKRISVILLVCESAPMAKKLSVKHRNSLMIGADGYVKYNKNTAVIEGVSTFRWSTNHDKSFIMYYNGAEVGRFNKKLDFRK